VVPSVAKDFSTFIYTVKHSKNNTDTNNSLQGTGTCTIVSNYVTVGGGGGELDAHSICQNKICNKQANWGTSS